MQNNKKVEIKMGHAYGFFNRSSFFNALRYKRGKENNFSSPEVIVIVKKRMKENNPTKNPSVREKVLLNRRANRAEGKTYLNPIVFKNKYVTPKGLFKSKKDIREAMEIPEWTLETIYKNLDSLPIGGKMGSKKLIIRNLGGRMDLISFNSCFLPAFAKQRYQKTPFLLQAPLRKAH